MSTLPKVPSKWVHYKGNEYEVYDLLNTDADPGRELDHPVIVCYRGANGKKWGKTLEVFLKTMTPKPLSAWDQRREEYRDKRVTSVSVPKSVPQYITHPVQEVELLKPHIKLYDQFNLDDVGAFIHIATRDSVPSLVRMEFVEELWNASLESGRSGLASADYLHVCSNWAERINLAPMNQVDLETYSRANIMVLSLRAGQPWFTGWVTGFGYDLHHWTLFLSYLRYVSQKYAGVDYTESHVHMIADDFNRLIDIAITNRMFHVRNAPRAVVEDYKLRFILPSPIGATGDPQYVETHFNKDVLRILFPKHLVKLIGNVFGNDCLVRSVQ